MTTFYFKTYGCSANQVDSEQMAGLLQKAQFVPSETIDDADIVIFNSCTVKGPSETQFFKDIEEFRKEHPYKICIVAGCIAQTDSHNPLLKDISCIGTKQIHRVVEVVEESLNDNIIKMLELDEMPPLNLPRIRKNPVIEIIPISRGCMGACTFCKTKAARKNLVSYPIQDIVKEARKAVHEGVKELWLTAQDTFCYGFDIETDLPTLLEKLVQLPGDFKIRIGMGNPNHIPKIGDRLLEMYKHPKVFKFVHLPLQAGDDMILKEMKRKYTLKDYFTIIKHFKTHFPQINIMTDIIVGYPTEKEEQYWGTLEAVRKLMPDSCNISRFWPRPGTPAASLKPLQGDDVKRRSRVLTGIFENISTLQNEKWIGWEGSIIVDEKGKEEKQWIGRNDHYKPVIVEGDFKLGDVVNVKIVKSGMFDLRGDVLH
ncbi:tRNA (N(6)-L-threonylcarbamoyladenosine(37)-C(2))-methylthiotransferase [Candidatus Woesearchaeota archaeon]|jgi:threonylcarbamoyladenosine tRNA methylthiotransferase CDKAL1|nr:tRNA (N(6)-L-threonylcarbamoyladenosine(37)-C(2))-methylthiotransferase [Candidatus Woesearchaeota archaeon]MBT5397531.1 tRNA (N(6)-L-threonylcarbamoyladenosine(37)-C(2))-methylthiotransferase [Candidatus Woesearchaeota archaeon]MBT6367896.1 tRNA (N(6)-L-threonylcarbamoyladenosine(37)-C(2))-methylthiotransferase [Candidatus Woesearchaeota archaeon]MBT7763120.1 tRNA (N(6)-L-threonylcarbamoyladenosine(37)-C(2))-methylthiotransferase [Candidatus Woesearchaeota archaeon]